MLENTQSAAMSLPNFIGQTQTEDPNFKQESGCFLQIKFLGSMIPFVACFLWFLCFRFAGDPLKTRHPQLQPCSLQPLFLGAVEPAIPVPPRGFFPRHQHGR